MRQLRGYKNDVSACHNIRRENVQRAEIRQHALLRSALDYAVTLRHFTHAAATQDPLLFKRLDLHGSYDDLIHIMATVTD
jgi:hypothetical protein